MSLINQMLKDLEDRGGLKSTDASAEADTIASVNQVTTKKTSPTFLIGSGLFLAIYLAGFYWFDQSDKTMKPQNNVVQQPVQAHQQPIQPETIVAKTHTQDKEDSNEAIIAEITAAIEQEVRAAAGDVDQAEIQQMVAQANQKNNAPNEQLVQQPTAPIVQKNKPASVKSPVNDVPTPPVKLAKTTTPTVKKILGNINANNVMKTATQVKHPVAQPVNESIAKATTLAAKTKKPVEEKLTKAVAKVSTRAAKPNIKKRVATTVNKPIRKATMVAKPLGKAHFVKQTNPSQKSEHLYQQAISLVQKGRVTEAQNMLAQALNVYPNNQDARQTLAALLLDNNRVTDAKTVLSQGLVINPDHTQFRMAVARLEVELGNRNDALNTLLAGANQATDNAKYQAFLATMLQRANRHEEAVKHFQYALRIDRGMTKAFVGLGMSLQALNRFEDAQVAYHNAQSNSSLNPNLKSFLDGRIKEVSRRISAR